MSEQRELVPAEMSDVEKLERSLTAKTESPGSIVDVIQRAATDPNVDVEKLERLMALYERVRDEERRAAYADAMARLQSRLPQVTKHGVNAHTKTAYAMYEDIDAAIRPLLAEEGFSLSFDEDSRDGAMVRYVLRITHRSGHREEQRLTLSIDEAARNREGRATRTATQSDGSTASYARRYLIKLALNLVERGEDDDGNGGSQPITEEQARDIDTAITDTRADRARFLAYMGVGSIEEILDRDYARAMNALESKRRGREGAR